MKRIIRSDWALAILAATLLCAPLAAADQPERNRQSDDSSSNAQANDGNTGVEELVITARKREENLQDTPIAVTAFSNQDLEDNNLTRVDDVSRFVPNLLFDSSAGQSNSSRLSIRGVGNVDPIVTRDNGVGVYLDGVYLARAQGQLFGLADIERIEVLRGPQGTLFGRNTIGGAVNVITRKPSDTNEGSLSARYGNYGLIETRGGVNFRLVPEKASARISFQTLTRDGYMENRLTGEDSDDRKLLGTHATLRLTPTDSFEFLLAGEATRSHQSGRGGDCRLQPDLVTAFPIANVENALNGFGANCQASESDNALKFSSPITTNDNTDTNGLSATINWDLGNNVTFKSLTAWRQQRNSGRQEFEFIPVNIATSTLSGERQDQYSQEFNLGGTAFDNKMKWTTGLFAMGEKSRPGALTTLVAFDICSLGGGPLCFGSTIGRARINNLAYAAYGQFTYDFTDQFHFTAGLRRSLEHKRYRLGLQNFSDPVPDNNPDGPPILPLPAFPFDLSDRFRAWTPMFNVDFDVAPNAMVYATWSKGFKSGGFNARLSSPPPISAVNVFNASQQPFKQELLYSYEVGTKTSWFDNHLVANVALFHNQYQDIQLTELSVNPGTGAFASRVSNAGKAVIRGAEVELRAVPTNGLELSAQLGFLDPQYKEFTQDDLFTGLPVNRKNEDFQYVADYTATFSASYRFLSMAGLGDLTARASWHMQNGVNYGPAGRSSELQQGKIGTLSATLTLEMPDGKTTIALFGDNLFDRRYIDSGINFETGFAHSTAFYAPPRMFGIEVRRSFK